MIGLLRYARFAAILLPVAALVFLGWHYLALTRDVEAAAAEIQRLAVQVETARQAAAATAEAANAEIERAQDILDRERAAAVDLRRKLDRIGRAADTCLDTPLPKGLLTP